MSRDEAAHRGWAPGSRHTSGKFQGVQGFVCGCPHCWHKEIGCMTIPKEKSHEGVQKGPCVISSISDLFVWSSDVIPESVWCNQLYSWTPWNHMWFCWWEWLVKVKIHSVGIKGILIFMWMSFVTQRRLLFKKPQLI